MLQAIRGTGFHLLQDWYIQVLFHWWILLQSHFGFPGYFHNLIYSDLINP
jgi:hypothetical protein